MDETAERTCVAITQPQHPDAQLTLTQHQISHALRVKAYPCPKRGYTGLQVRDVLALPAPELETTEASLQVLPEPAQFTP